MARPALLLALALAATAAGADDFKVVVNAENPEVTIARTLLSRYFLKKAARWPDGVVVEPVEPALPKVREKFAAQVHEKSVNALKAYWNQLIFAGREVPPVEKHDDAEVVAFVRQNRGAIGYVTPGAATDGVKVVTVSR